ncbi:hypothetical protein JL722_13954 [Aureococcus anophagefferens]|nr:hypothetical protein JL722_13954 [Aureococcus anophagefferens]
MGDWRDKRDEYQALKSRRKARQALKACGICGEPSTFNCVCGTIAYCSQACKTVDWRDRGHREARGGFATPTRRRRPPRGALGLARDAPRAVELYGRASDLGDVEATVALAYALHVGDGVARDDERALELCRAAADWGHAKAQCDYGTTLYERREFEAAFAYYVHSAHQGFTLAEFYVGRYLHLARRRPRLEATAMVRARGRQGPRRRAELLRDLTEGRREVTRTELEVSAALAAEAFDRAPTRAELEAELAATADDAEVARAANAALAEEARAARAAFAERAEDAEAARGGGSAVDDAGAAAANAALAAELAASEAARVALAERAEDAEAARAANAALVDDAGAACSERSAGAELAASRPPASRSRSARKAPRPRARRRRRRSSTTREPRVQRSARGGTRSLRGRRRAAERAEDAEAALSAELFAAEAARAAAEAARAALTQDHACDLEGICHSFITGGQFKLFQYGFAVVNVGLSLAVIRGAGADASDFLTPLVGWVLTVLLADGCFFVLVRPLWLESQRAADRQLEIRVDRVRRARARIAAERRQDAPRELKDSPARELETPAAETDAPRDRENSEPSSRPGDEAAPRACSSFLDAAGRRQEIMVEGADRGVPLRV